MSQDDESYLLRLYKERLRDFTQRKKALDYVQKRKRRLSDPQSAASVIREVFKGDAETLRKIEETKAILAWDEIVGKSISKAAQALRIRGTQLIVKAPDPLWMQNLALMKNDILHKYREFFPNLKLTDIYFVS